MHRILTDVHLNTAREELANAAGRVMGEPVERTEETEALLDALLEHARSILLGKTHKSKALVLAKAFSLQDFVARQEEEVDKIDVMIDLVEIDEED